MDARKIAIVGSGYSGLALARMLQHSDELGTALKVTIYEQFTAEHLVMCCGDLELLTGKLTFEQLGLCTEWQQISAPVRSDPISRDH